MTDEKQAKIAALLSQPVLARLATADLATGQPNVVPVWFLWDGKGLWISSFKNTNKIKTLRKNPRTAVLIEPDADHPGALTAVILHGQVEIIAGPPEFVASKSIEIYTRYMGEDGVQAAEPQSWAHDPDNLILHLQPERTIAW